MILKRIISVIITVFILLINVVTAEKTSAASYFSGGAGTLENPYRIMTKEHLCNISFYPDAHYILMRDLEFTSEDFNEDGVCAGGWKSPDNFTGVFDGLGNSITNLQGTDGGFVNENNGIIDSVIFKNHRLSGTDTFGSVADINNGTITRCNVNLDVTDDISPVAKYSGGIAGKNSGEISYSQVSGNLYITGPQYRYCYVYTGGFAGQSSGRITNCYNNIYINVYSPYITEYAYIGGICGMGNAYNCRNDGSMYINASMDYDIYASPFGNYSSYSSYFCYGSLRCTSTDNYKLNRYNTHNNVDCYTYVDSPQNGLEENFPKLDFDKNWMITSIGPMPQGIMNDEGNCLYKKSYTAPDCEENGISVYKNQYDETTSVVLQPIGHKPNADDEGCLRDGCSKNVITALSLNITETSIFEGETAELIASFLPENATDKTLAWTSSDDSIATVDEQGIVTGINTGEVTITVSSVSGKSATCNITVEKKQPIYPESSHPYDSYANEWQEYTCMDSDAKSLTIKFSEQSYLENNYDYVYVYDAEGILVRKYTGSQLSGAELVVNGSSFKIHLTSDSGVNYYGYSIESVTARYDEVTYYVPIEDIYIYSTRFTKSDIGDCFQIDYSVYPEYTTSHVVWTSSDENIATIDERGIITVKDYGEVLITAESSDGNCYVSQYVSIFSDTPIEEIYFDSWGYYQADIGDEIWLSHKVYPEDTTSYVIFTSSDEKIATIDNQGIITVKGYGDVIITAQSSDGIYQTDVYLTISARVFKNVNSIKLNVGDSFNLKLISKTEDEIICSWYSYDDSVARFNNEGVVEAVSEGYTQVYNTFDYTNVDISVTEGYSGYIVNGTYTLMAGNEYPIPVTGDDDGNVWGYSLDDSIAEYDSSTGMIKAVSEGECEIYTDYGWLSIYVYEPYVDEYTIENGIITEYYGEAEKLVIPDEINGETITGIGSYAFNSDYLKNVTIPGTVKVIGESAFSGCGFLEQVVLEEGVETIGASAFRGLNRLTYLELPASLEIVEGAAFGGTTPDEIVYNGTTTDWIYLDISWGNDCFEVISKTHGRIYTKAQLYEIAEAVNSKKTTHAYKNFTLMNNISLENEEWIPIGIYDNDYAFVGDFDGNGYTVSDFKITIPRKYNGFFGCVERGAVKNLKIKNAVIDVVNTEEVGWSWSGLMVGWLYHGNADNCSAEGVIRVFGNTNENNAGGLIGRVSSTTVNNCSADIKIELRTDNGLSTYIGGLIGYMYGTVMDCAAMADIKFQVKERTSVGGIVGYQASDSVSVTGSTSRGSINGIIFGECNFVDLGGIIGCNRKLAENNTSYMDIVYSSKYDICAEKAIGRHPYDGSQTEKNNIGYGSLYRAPYAEFDFSESEKGNVCDYTVTTPELNGNVIFVSLYSKNKLLETIIVTESISGGTLELSEKPDKYKIFVWDERDKITPVHSSICGVTE